MYALIVQVRIHHFKALIILKKHDEAVLAQRQQQV